MDEQEANKLAARAFMLGAQAAMVAFEVKEPSLTPVFKKLAEVADGASVLIDPEKLYCASTKPGLHKVLAEQTKNTIQYHQDLAKTVQSGLATIGSDQENDD